MAETRSHQNSPSTAPAPDHYRLSLVKGQERWIFRWDPGDEAALINLVARMARNPEVPLDLYDAAVICKHIAQPQTSSPSSTSCASHDQPKQN